jgi:Ca2+-binding RTX toxin-like protein
MAVFNIDDVVVGEGQGFVDFVIRLNVPLGQTVTVQYQTYSGSATTSDYTPVSGSLSFAPGETVKTVRVTINNDGSLEGLQSFGLELFNAVGAGIGRTDAIATIVDNDAAPGTPLVTAGNCFVDETGVAHFVISLDRPSAGPVTLNFATANGTALAGSDYQATSGQLTFAAGETSKTVDVPLLNDATAEGAEAFRLLLSNVVGATTLGANATAIIAASDQATAATPVIQMDDVMVGEAQGYVDFVVRLSAPSTQAVSVAYQTFSASATTVDYEPQDGQITFDPGETMKTIRIIVDDAGVVEGRLESFGVELFNPSNGLIGRSEAIATIVDNDAASGTPVATIGDVQVDESGIAQIVINLDRPSAGSVSMDYTTVAGTALAGTDFLAASGRLVFAAGESSKTILIPLVNDAVAEQAETFSFQLSNPTGVGLPDAGATIVIGASDQAAAATPVITVDHIVVGEDQGYAEFLVRLSAPSTQAVGVEWQTYSGTASGNNSDFSGSSGELVFAAGEMLKVVRISLSHDIITEKRESFGFELFNASGGLIGRTDAIATLIDDEGTPGTPQISVGDVVVDENGVASFAITLDRPPAGPVTVDYLTANGTALAGSDYLATSGRLSFVAGETSKTVVVPILTDALAEGAEAFSLVLHSANGGIITDGGAVAVIGPSDQATAPQPSIGIDDAVINEGKGFADVVVRLNAPSTLAVTVSYQTASGTASTSDYGGQDGQITFAPGETVRVIRIPITDDTSQEALQSFEVDLFNASNATIGRTSAVVTIVDNDSAAAATGSTLTGGTGADTLLGTDQDDVLDGAGGSDFLAGGAGNDQMFGRAGDDVYVVDAAGDQVSEAAGSGFDTVVSLLATYILPDAVEALDLAGFGQTGTGNAGANTINGSAGNDLLNGLGGIDTTRGGAGDDMHLVDNALDVVVEGAAEGTGDRVLASVSYALGAGVFVELLTTTNAAGTGAINLTGNEIAQTLQGNAGANTLDGRGGADLMAGLGGNDFYFVDNAGDRITEGASEGAVDRVFASVSYTLGAGVYVEVLATTNNAGTTALNLTGNELANIVYGNAAANVLDGRAGADTLQGLAGNDFYFVDVAGDKVLEAAGAGSDRIFAAVSYALAAGAEVEMLTTANNAGTAALNLTGNEFAQTIQGNAGANVLDGKGGADILQGLQGNDVYYVDNAGDRVLESDGQGSDRVIASASWVLGAGVSVETRTTVASAATTAINLTGNAFAQSMVGNAGANRLDSGGGGDTMVGLGGDDFYFIRAAGDRAVEAAGGGNDRVFAAVSFTLEAGSAVETLGTIANTATTAINLIGNELAQSLLGNAGVNILDGKAGADTLAGFGGADQFRFTTALGGGNVDRLVDFVSGSDKIVLDDAIFGGIGTPGAFNANAFVSGAAAADLNDRIIYNSATGQLLYDADGTGGTAAVLFATLDGHPALAASDFLVI